MTIRLYEQDSELLDFTATVLSCEPKGNLYLVELDRTAFFPEGGGQGADHGQLGNAQVTDCHDVHGTILHTLSAPLTPGSTVEGHVDGVRRLSMMQQHSGEHIFSGLVHQHFGYNNVGFHIGSDAVTMDFDGKMTLEDALHIEYLVNEAIWKDLPVQAYYPGTEALEHIDYRSKKAIDGDVRIVTIEGYDTCACCGTHVKHTGQIGQVKVTAFQNYKSGVRISILCGMRALAFENELLQENREVSHITSAKTGELAAAVAHLTEERDHLRYEMSRMASQLFTGLVSASQDSFPVLRADFLPVAQLRPSAGEAAESRRGALVISKREDGWNYAMCSKEMDVRPVSRELQRLFSGKGGGTPDMVQGVLGAGTEEDIRAAVPSLLPDA
ncbi:MAG: alanyl-tRNA editing protein [Clostridia bacterium]|nr:alanyl-tRNA editing protein [Clostridia bacterium]